MHLIANSFYSDWSLQTKGILLSTKQTSAHDFIISAWLKRWVVHTKGFLMEFTSAYRRIDFTSVMESFISAGFIYLIQKLHRRYYTFNKFPAVNETLNVQMLNFIWSPRGRCCSYAYMTPFWRVHLQRNKPDLWVSFLTLLNSFRIYGYPFQHFPDL